MNQLEEIRQRLDLCDKKIVSVLEERMDIIKEIMVYKKENGLPILQPEQEKHQRKMLMTHVSENTYKNEILDIFAYILENSRRIQARTLFTHNILLIGFMGVGKSTVSSYLSKILASPYVEMDQEIVDKEGMSINKIFEPYFTTKRHGTGLGLTNVVRIIEAHNGNITIESEYGKGSEFIIKLPLQQENQKFLKTDLLDYA